MNAIDTNVLVYAIDESEAVKQSEAIHLLKSLGTQPIRLVLLWQVAVEFLACLRRWEAAGRITRDDTLAYKTEFLDSPPIVLPSQNGVGKKVRRRIGRTLADWPIRDNWWSYRPTVQMRPRKDN